MNPPPGGLASAIETVDTQKSAIRRTMLARLEAQAPAGRERRSAAIVNQLLASPAWDNARTVLLFHPLGSEPDISPLLDCPDRHIVLPRVVPSGLDLHRYTGPGALRRSSYGLLEPDPDKCPDARRAAIDLAIVPGLAFDPHSRMRLGRGGGYYDRLLADADFGAITIGVAFAFQLCDHLPASPHDRAVDQLISA